jgi:membrane-bound lytic murein transglycosylase A
MRKAAAALLLAAGLAACAVPEPGPVSPAGPGRMALTPLGYDQLAGWSEDESAAILPALLKSCARITKLPLDKSIGHEGVGGTAADWYSVCSAAQRVAAGDHKGARALFETWLAPWQVSSVGKTEGLFTGYFEP